MLALVMVMKMLVMVKFARSSNVVTLVSDVAFTSDVHDVVEARHI